MRSDVDRPNAGTTWATRRSASPRADTPATQDFEWSQFSADLATWAALLPVVMATSMARHPARIGCRGVESEGLRQCKECEQRVRKALTKLTKTGVPFTVENVYQLAGVGKTFIYDKRHPELTKTVLAARDASQVAATTRAERNVDEQTASWRERALNAEALSKKVRADIKDRDARIAELTGQLYDPDGTLAVCDRLSCINTRSSCCDKASAKLASISSRRSRRSASTRADRRRDREVVGVVPMQRLPDDDEAVDTEAHGTVRSTARCSRLRA